MKRLSINENELNGMIDLLQERGRDIGISEIDWVLVVRNIVKKIRKTDIKPPK